MDMVGSDPVRNDWIDHRVGLGIQEMSDKASTIESNVAARMTDHILNERDGEG